MKSFLTGLCLLLVLMSGSSAVLAKDGTTTAGTVKKAEFKNTIVHLNKADANTFSYYLKGIGPAKAKAIVDYRKSNGNFSNIDDLLKVPGIGEATFKGLKSNVSLSRGETTAPKTASSGSTKKSTSSSSNTAAKSSKSTSDTKSVSSKTSDKTTDKKSSKETSKSTSKSSSSTKSDSKSTKTTSTKSTSKKSDTKCDTAKEKASKACQ